MTPAERSAAGEVGYLIAGIKDVRDARVGDTITAAAQPGRASRCPATGRPSRWSSPGSTPSDSDDYERLRDALEKLQLNDAALQLRAGNLRRAGLRLPLRLPRPAAHGDRPGAAGARVRPGPDRHRAQRRRTRSTARRRRMVTVDNPADMPDPGRIERIEEPMVRATIITPTEYVGAIMELCQDKRGRFGNISYLAPTRVLLTYDLPLAEILVDFFDKLKSRTRGYASLDYEYRGYEAGRPGEAGHPAQRRARRRALLHHPPGPRLRARARAVSTSCAS